MRSTGGHIFSNGRIQFRELAMEQDCGSDSQFSGEILSTGGELTLVLSYELEIAFRLIAHLN